MADAMAGVVPGEHGLQQIVFPGEGIYVGDVHQKMRHGDGKFWLVSGDVYDGAWVRGKMHGVGLMKYETGPSIPMSISMSVSMPMSMTLD